MENKTECPKCGAKFMWLEDGCEEYECRSDTHLDSGHMFISTKCFRNQLNQAEQEITALKAQLARVGSLLKAWRSGDGYDECMADDTRFYSNMKAILSAEPKGVE